MEKFKEMYQYALQEWETDICDSDQLRLSHCITFYDLSKFSKLLNVDLPDFVDEKTKLILSFPNDPYLKLSGCATEITLKNISKVFKDKPNSDDTEFHTYKWLYWIFWCEKIFHLIKAYQPNNRPFQTLIWDYINAFTTEYESQLDSQIFIENEKFLSYENGQYDKIQFIVELTKYLDYCPQEIMNLLYNTLSTWFHELKIYGKHNKNIFTSIMSGLWNLHCKDPTKFTLNQMFDHYTHQLQKDLSSLTWQNIYFLAHYFNYLLN